MCTICSVTADLSVVDFGEIFGEYVFLNFEGEFLCQEFVEGDLGWALCVVCHMTEVDTLPKVSVIASLAELPSGGYISTAVSSLTGLTRLIIATVSSC